MPGATTTQHATHPPAAAPVPAAGALAPAEVRRGLRLSVIEGALANVHISVTGGAFLTGFALLLGANSFDLGLIAALPFIGQLFSFVGAYLEQRTGERRRTASLLAGASRVAWLFFALLPFLGGLGAVRMPLFLACFAVTQAMYAVAANLWLSWMSDLVPARQRGRYFGMRNTVASVTAMASTWLAGRALDRYRSSGQEALGYLVLFGLCAAFGLAAAIILWRQPEPPLPPQARRSPVELLSAPLRDPGFRGFILASTAWAIVTGVASPFFNAYGLQYLRLSYATLALTAVVTSAVALAAQPLIGRLQDRYGDKRVLVWSVAGVVLLPWGWVLSTPTFLLPLWMTSFFAGVFWPAITQGLANLLMERAPADGRGAYVAAYSTITGAGTFCAGLLGGVLATWLGNGLVHLGPLTLNHYAMLFVLSSLGRAAMVLVFARRL
jgi:MFS family permease